MIVQPQNILVTLNTEHHIERYSLLPHNLTDFLQYKDCSTQFFTKKLSSSLSITETASFLDILHNEYGLSDIDLNFIYKTQSNFSTFFSENNIDIPSCFKRSNSLLNAQNTLPLLKFINFLMRHGKKLQISTLVIDCIRRYLGHHYYTTNYNKTLNWKTLFLSFNFLVKTKNYKFLQTWPNDLINFNNRLTRDAKHMSIDFNTYSLLFKNIVKLEPMFSFYIYKVDKKIYKNTRGKSGKYTFLWKFIPPYKRQFFVFTWLVRELKLKPGKNFLTRLDELFNLLITNFSKTWIFRVKKFSYNYVYRNCRQSLAETYRTSTK